MQLKYIKKKLAYSGKELSSLFAYKHFDLQGDSVVAFCGPCHVDLPDMVDQADVKQKAFIKSDLMVHFIGEFFQLKLTEGILRQRLYIAVIKDVLELFSKEKFSRSGDDLYLRDKKASVSIATLSPVSTMIHIGVNISSENTPVKTVGLSDLKIAPDKFIAEVLKRIEAEESGIKNARAKVRGVS